VNYVTNPLNADRLEGVHGRLSTTTPGVTILRDKVQYKKLQPGETKDGDRAYRLLLSPGFVRGADIELALDVHTSGGDITLRHTLFTGTPAETTLLAEGFDGVAPGALPLDWRVAHGGGTNTVPWITNTGFCGNSTNAAFHANAQDGPAANNNTRFERLFSPVFVVPADSDYVTLEFDVCYNTEDDPNFNVQAFDGLLLRVTDLTTGRTLRSNLAEAFATEFTTGAIQHYPKHLPRNNNAAYFQDMSVWAGDSQGAQRVRIRLPGMEGSTAQLRFEYTQDSVSTCADVRPGAQCGVSIDNLVLKSVINN
jgi:hypothetical protein